MEDTLQRSPHRPLLLGLLWIALASCGQSGILTPQSDRVPGIDEITPNPIPTGSSPELTIYGTAFDSSAVVRWEGKDLPTTLRYSGPTRQRLSARLEEEALAEAGEYAVTVWSPGGGESGVMWVRVVPGSTIRGRVTVDDTGIPGVEVRLRPAEGLARTEPTADGGEYIFDGILPGTYTVEFQLPEVSTIVFPDSARTVQVEAESSTARVDFDGEIVGEIPGGALLRGSVRDENGDPLSAVPITVRSSGSEGSGVSPYVRALHPGGSEANSTETGPDGRFEIGVAPGEVEVEAHAPDREEDHWLKSFQALDRGGTGEKWVYERTVSPGDTAMADFAWISCVEGSLEYGEEIETQLTSEDCVHPNHHHVRELWAFEGQEGDFVNIYSQGEWCSPLILLDPETTELKRESHGCAAGENWITATLPRDGTYYVVETSDNAAARYDDGGENRSLFVARTSPWTAVVAGGRHSCGLSPEGRAWCWGDNAAGQLGDGTTERSPAPVAVAGGLSFRRLSAGASYTCGVATSGELYCWGDNSGGQLGDGSATSRRRPVRVDASGTFEAVSASLTGAHTCAVDADGGAWCWGSNGSGQLGDGSTSSSGARRPVRVAGDARFRAIAAGGMHTCALAEGGEPYCWGANRHGQLGDGTTEGSLAPAPVAGGLTAGAVAAGHRHSCVVDPDAPIEESSYCWGRNEASGEDRLVPEVVAYDGPGRWGTHGGGDVSGLSAGGDRTCVIIDHAEQLDRAYCWQPGAAGNGWTGGWTRYASVTVGGDDDGDHVCAVGLAGAAHCWGSNGFGQLGRGTFEDSPEARPVLLRPEEERPHRQPVLAGSVRSSAVPFAAGS